MSEKCKIAILLVEIRVRIFQHEAGDIRFPYLLGNVHKNKYFCNQCAYVYVGDHMRFVEDGFTTVDASFNRGAVIE